MHGISIAFYQNISILGEEDFNLKIGEEKNFKNFQIKFSSLEVNEKKNYKTCSEKTSKNWFE